MSRGTARGNRRFLPLDGQQRLTTLFLLHWYLAWHDNAIPQFQEMACGTHHSRFSYEVRPSSTEFFDELVRFQPACDLNGLQSVRKLIEDQNWFFLYWRLDPTIQSALTMLDAIHDRFRESRSLFARLTDEGQPAITFQLLQLEHFGLSDELYIKMNARGKPLTEFETFKARFEEHLKQLYPADRRLIDGKDVSVPQFFERRMDTHWTDFFWHYKDAASDTFDGAVMNVLWAVARISLDTDSETFEEHTSLLRGRYLSITYATFHSQGWLTRAFTDNVMRLLETWSEGGGRLRPCLADTRYFNEPAIFQKAREAPATLEYVELVQLAAFVSYLEHTDGDVNAEEFQAWARIIFNLNKNSAIERPYEYGRSLSGIQAMLPHSKNILEALSSAQLNIVGFNTQQVREEILKARLILADSGWRSRIDAAEQHGYFAGQIEFLLDFAGVIDKARIAAVGEWKADVHAELQTQFDEYLTKARLTFADKGLVPVTGQPFLWERALLVCGDYLSSNGSNYSFLTNPVGWDSWKRYLRGEPTGNSPRRRYLKVLWDRIDAGADLAAQLLAVVNGRAGLEAWRETVIRFPQSINYCDRREIRKMGPGRVYLLKKSRMNGAHAELFSYALYQELIAREADSLAPLKVHSYRSVTMSEAEPDVLLLYDSEQPLFFSIESADGNFRIKTRSADLQDRQEMQQTLVNQTGFAVIGDLMIRSCARAEIHDVLRQIASALATAANPVSAP
jgi:hypothetical protein